MKKWLVLIIILLVILAVLTLFLTGAISKITGKATNSEEEKVNIDEKSKICILDSCINVKDNKT